MPDPLNFVLDDIVSLSVRVGGAPISDLAMVARVEVETGVNRIPRARVRIIDGSAVDGTFALSDSGAFSPGQDIEVLAGYQSFNTPIFKGIILSQGLKVQGAGNSYLELSCADPAVKMTFQRSSRQFVDTSDSDVLLTLIRDAGLDGDVPASDGTHEVIVKHEATDWDFLVMRAEALGRVVIADGGTVSIRPPDFEPPELVVQYGDSIASLDLEVDASTQVPPLTASAWDPATQKVVSAKAGEPALNDQGDLDGDDLAADLGVTDGGLRSARSLSREDLKAWAEARMMAARLARIRGSIRFPGTALANPGAQIGVIGLGRHLNGTGYITGVHHVLQTGNWSTEVTLGLPGKGFAERHTDVSAPKGAGQAPGVSGVQIAKVLQTHEDPLGQRRVKVQLVLQPEDSGGQWVRVLQPYASKEAGLSFLPEVGDEVVLAFVDGDPNAAVLMGALHSSARAGSAVPDEANTLKEIVTKSKLSLSFNDTDKTLTVKTPGGREVVLDDKAEAITIRDAAGNAVEMTKTGIALTSDGDIAVAAKGKLTLSGQKGIEAKSSGDVSAKGKSVKLQGQQSLSAKGGASAEITSSGRTAVKGTLVAIN